LKTYPYKLLVIIGLHFILFSLLGLSRHWGYMTSINDLGAFDQAIWGGIHKGFLLNSFGTPQSLTINWLGIHFNIALYLFIPFYYLFPSENWLIFSQAFALSFAAFPLFLLAKQISNSESQAVLWSIIYLFNPFVMSADVWDFHPVCLAVPFIILAFLAIEQQRPYLFTIANIALLICQEQFGLTVAGFGLLYGFKNHEKRLSTSFFILGIIFFILILAIIMPNLSPTKQHIMFGNPSGDNSGGINRYGWLGHSPKELVETLIFSPKYVLKTVLIKFEGWLYLKQLFFPILFTALAAPLFMLPMGADLLANFLSEIPLPRNIFSYHSVTIIPVVTVAAIYGCQTIAKNCSFLPSSQLIKYICCSTLTLGYFFAPLPLPFAANIWKPVQVIAQYDKREDEIKALVNNHSVSVQANIGAHFTQREKLYLFPRKISDSDYVILWLSKPTTNDDYFSAAYTKRALHHIQIPPNAYLTQIENLLSSKNFKIAYWNDPWLVFKREPKIENDEREIQVLEKINVFRQKLQTPSPSL
jgi:uncharacterized membrane protein